MKHYRVRFTVNGCRYDDEISATSYFDARRLIEARYPGAVIWLVQEVRG